MDATLKKRRLYEDQENCAKRPTTYIIILIIGESKANLDPLVDGFSYTNPVWGWVRPHSPESQDLCIVSPHDHTNKTYVPMLLTIFLAANGPDGSGAVVRRQVLQGWHPGSQGHACSPISGKKVII